MALNIPEFPSPYMAAPFQNAYGWITSISLDFASQSGRLTVSVHASSADAGASPIGTVVLQLGQIVQADPSGQVAISTLSELMENPDFVSAFNVLRTILYNEAIKH